MNKATLLIIFTSFSLGAVRGHGLPSFAWDGTRSSIHGVPHLTIQFPDGSTDAAVLKRVNPIPLQPNEREEDVDACIFQGHLETDPNNPVAVTGGCPFSSEFEVTMFSDRLSGHSFIVKQQNVERVDLSKFKHDYLIPEGQVENRDTNFNCSKPFPLKGFRMLMKVYSDASFKLRFGNSSWNVYRRSLNHAQAFFYHPTLTTKIQLVVVETGDVKESMFVNGTFLDRFTKYADNWDINSYFLLTHQPSAQQDYVLGLAFVRTTCDFVRWRSGIGEWVSSDTQAGGTIAHEVGHNLGMHHDFINGGKDSTGKNCKGIQGVMDYGTQTIWSSCSLEYFCSYYSSMTRFCIRENFRN